MTEPFQRNRIIRATKTKRDLLYTISYALERKHISDL